MQRLEKLISKAKKHQEQIAEMWIEDCIQMRGVVVYKVFCKVVNGKNERWIVNQFPTKDEAISEAKHLTSIYPTMEGIHFEDWSVIPKATWNNLMELDDDKDASIELFLQMKRMAVKAWQEGD